jgi:hypothetical protein
MKLEIPVLFAKTYAERLAQAVFGPNQPRSKYLDFKDYIRWCKTVKENPSHYSTLMHYKSVNGL